MSFKPSSLKDVDVGDMVILQESGYTYSSIVLIKSTDSRMICVEMPNGRIIFDSQVMWVWQHIGGLILHPKLDELVGENERYDWIHENAKEFSLIISVEKPMKEFSSEGELQAPQKRQEKPCPRCGRMNDLGVKDCWHCGIKDPTS